MSFFSFPEDGHWSEADEAVVFTVEIGEYAGKVRLPRTVIRRLIGRAVTPEQCVEHYHLERSRYERAAEIKVRRRELDDDSNVTLIGRDLRSSDLQRPAETGDALFERRTR